MPNYLKIKFLYNTRSHCFINSVLYESTKRGTNERSRYQCNLRNDEFPNFSLGIIPELEEDFLCDSDKEEENEFLAAVDLEAVNVTD